MNLDDLVKEQRCILTPDISVRQAATLLAEHHVFVAPLVDSSQHVIAVLSQSDLLRLLIAGKKSELLATSVLELAAVGRSPFLKKGDSIAHACKLFLSVKLESIVVVDGMRRLQGSVSQIDLINAMYG